jgi:hypothetical protein
MLAYPNWLPIAGIGTGEAVSLQALHPIRTVIQSQETLPVKVNDLLLRPGKINAIRY